MSTVTVANISIGNDAPLTIIAGPCQLESADHAQMVAGVMKEACTKAGAQYIFKSSFDKANRTSVGASRGLGMEKGLQVLSDLRKALDVPVLTDVHKESQCAPAAEAVDVLQIPAYLCRQTDLLLAAGNSGAAINVKKGQFLAPWDMQNVVDKIASTGNERVLLTERGSTFGYNTLVADMRSLPQMAQTGCPVIMDATHSVQQPGGLGGASGGQRELAPVMARAAVAVGVAGVFIETHQDPDNAPCDGPNMIFLDQMADLVALLMDLDRLAKEKPLSFS